MGSALSTGPRVSVNTRVVTSVAHARYGGDGLPAAIRGRISVVVEFVGSPVARAFSVILLRSGAGAFSRSILSAFFGPLAAGCDATAGSPWTSMALGKLISARME